MGTPGQAERREKEKKTATKKTTTTTNTLLLHSTHAQHTAAHTHSTPQHTAAHDARTHALKKNKIKK